MAHAAAKRSIGFLLPDLNGGGAERMTLNLLPALQALGHEVFLIVGSPDGELWRAIPPGIEVLCLNTSSWAGLLMGLWTSLPARAPDVLIASMGRCNMAAIWSRAAAGVRTKIVIREHSLVSELSALAGGRGAWTPAFYRVFARFADAIVAVSDGVADDMAHVSRRPRDTIRVIDNPVLTPGFVEQCAASVDHPFFTDGGPPVFVGVGRLERIKNFALLVDAFAQLRLERDARLVLIGEGAERAALEAQVERLGVAQDVAFLGFQERRLAFIARAAALVSSSLSEGLPNVLIEALAAGTQVVSTDCTAGPRQILEDGRYGTLVPVGDAAAMARAMMDAIDRPRPVEAGRQHVQRYTAANAATGYDALIRELFAP